MVTPKSVPQPTFQVIHDRHQRGSRLEVTGDCDAHSADRLRAALTDALETSPVVEVVLDAVGFMDSSGLGTLIAARHNAVERRQVLTVTSASPQVRRLFVQAGVAVDFGWPTFAPANLGALQVGSHDRP